MDTGRDMKAEGGEGMALVAGMKGALSMYYGC